MRLILLILPLLFLTAGCGGHHSEPPSEVSADTPLTFLAWKLRNDGAPADSFIAMQQRAVEQLRRGECDDDPVAVLEQMGFFLYITGDYESALDYYLEASDSMQANPDRPRGEGAIQLFGDLSLLYGQLGLMDEAFQYNDSSLAECRRQGGIMMSDVYGFRSGFYQQLGQNDEALRCYDLALRAIDEGRTNADKAHLRAIVNGERGYFMLEAFSGNADSVNRAVSLLEESMKHETSDTSNHYFSLGLGYSLQGQHERGLAIMERMRDHFRDIEDLEMLNYACNALTEEYARLGMWKQVGEIFPEQKALEDSMSRIRSNLLSIGATVRYQTQVQKARNEQLRRELGHARNERRMAVAIAVLSAIILGIAAAAVWRRYRKAVRQSRQQARQLTELSDSHAMVLDRVQSLETNLSAKINNNIEILSTPRLIVGEEQGAFRRAFNALYPNFISDLHRDYSGLTSNDDLLCMLIYLQHTTEEVAVYLGISRASVNSARYRLRRKFALANSSNLDEFLTSRPG